MSRTRVKICGITCADDALLAAQAGADAIGLIFHPPASRGISIATAENILAELPPFVCPMGLFLDALPKRMLSLADRLGLRWLQLHGHETPAQVKELKDLYVIKAIHVRPNRLKEDLQPWRRAREELPNLRGLVLETGWASVAGGSGIENDWEQIRQLQESGAFEGMPPVILAGGLKPRKVTRVVRMLRPWAVDVSSGVEEVKGRKSVKLVESFIAAVQKADRLSPSDSVFSHVY